MTEPLDAPLLDRTDDALARPLPTALGAARSDALAAATAVAAIAETDLTRPWAWIGGSEEELRYAAYRAAEALELAEVEARALVAADDAAESRAGRIVAPATAARWDLHGLLLPLPDELLDADPGGGEWTIRLALGHVVNGQRAYGWGTGWWLDQERPVGDPDLPPRIPEAVYATLPDEATTEAAGTNAEILARLDEVLDLCAERLAGLPDDRLELAARWSGFPVTIGFRLGRWGSHIREHTIQVEKTLAILGIVPDESRRLARHVLAAYGRAEAAVFGRRPSPALDAAAARLAAGASEARAAVASAQEEASAGR